MGSLDYYRSYATASTPSYPNNNNNTTTTSCPSYSNNSPLSSSYYTSGPESPQGTYPATTDYYGSPSGYCNCGCTPLPPPSPQPPLYEQLLPVGTARTSLHGRMMFHAFPQHTFHRGSLRRPAPAKQYRAPNITQLFFGQLPFRLTDAMVLHLFEHYVGAQVVYIERIVQDNSKKGCMQVYVYEHDADRVISALHKRVLFDQTGVWIANTAAEMDVLQRHGDDSRNRFKGLPFYPMVVERSRNGAETAVVENRSVNSPQCSCASCMQGKSLGYPQY